MKILLLAPQPFFQNRGTPIAVKLLAEVLGNEGHNVHMLTYHEGEDVNIHNLKVDRIPFLPGLGNIRPGFSFKKLVSDIVMFLYCWKILNKYKFDLIHAVEESVFMAVVFKLIFKIPYIYDMDSCLSDQVVEQFNALMFLKKKLEFFERIAVKNSIGVVAVCKSLQEFSQKCSVYKPILRLEDISLLTDSGEKGDLLREMLDIQGPIVMYVGNLEKYQGIDLLIHSFRFAVKQCPDARLVVIGGDPKHIRKYENKIKLLGIENQVHFVGPRPIEQLGFYLRQADILVSPRMKGENTPMKIYSYLDSGKPLVATRLPTHTQVLDDDISVLTEPEPQAMAKGIVSLIQHPEFGGKLSKHAEKRILQEYSYEAFHRKLSGFYKRLSAIHSVLKKDIRS